MQEFTFQVTSEHAGKRLDQFLVACLPDVSRARVQELIDQQKVLVNGAPAKRSLKLGGHELVQVTGAVERPPLRAIAEDIPLDVVYEDDYLAVINKPAGMMVHAGAGATGDERNRGTLVNALLHRFGALSDVGGVLRPGIVHRLDRETSGLIVVAKNDYSHRKLSEQFAARQVKKKYIALVHGFLKTDAGTIDAPISRDAVRRTRMTTRRTGGRDAVTHYRVLERFESDFGKFTLIEVKIDTGRTHQIRVHMASIGHPVVGDTLYGAPRELVVAAHDRKIGTNKGPTSRRKSAPDHSRSAANQKTAALGRNFLHSAAIELIHPRSGEPLSFERELPPELKEFMAAVRPDKG